MLGDKESGAVCFRLYSRSSERVDTRPADIEKSFVVVKHVTPNVSFVTEL